MKMPPTHPAFIIVGQGLAGSAMAWRLWQRGQSFLLIDDDLRPHTASRVAAGLITPVTGQRWTIAADFATQWDIATRFYSEVEKLTQQPFFHPRPYVRLGKSEADLTHLARLPTRPETAPWIRPGDVSLPAGVVAPFGAVAFTAGGYIDVPRYLAATRAFFSTQVISTTIDHHALVQAYPDATIIFCEGIAAQHNPFFGWVRWRPAKGQLLTLRLPTWTSTSIISRGQWLVPLPDGLARLGATYEWQPLDDTPTLAARDFLLTEASTWLNQPLKSEQVIAHTAAVRPIIRKRHALLGRHPVYPQLIFFNGLGSKGSLSSPTLASLLCDHLLENSPLPAEYDLRHND